MSQEALVSVVVRTRDRPFLLRQALESIVRQTYRNVQAVVVNDGGCDIHSVLSELAPRLNLAAKTHTESLGRCAAANTGLALAQGKWLVFLDDDDLLLRDGIRTLVEAAGETSCVCYGRVDAFHYQDGHDGPASPRFDRSFGREFDAVALHWENFIPINACLLPTAAVRDAGGLDESLPCFEDWDLFLRLSDSLPFRFIDVPVAEYRLIGEAFILGRGGEELQRRGQRAIISKHRHRYTPEMVSDVLHFGKSAYVLRARAEAAGDLPERLARTEAENAFLRKMITDSSGVSVSVVVVNYTGRHHQVRCLPALMATDGVSFEVIVADNGSSDDSVSWTQEHFPAVKVLELGRNFGFAEANRRSLIHATGTHVAFLNSDTVVEPGWLSALLRTLLSDSDIAAACSTLRFLHEPELLNARGGLMTYLGYGHDQDFSFPADDDRPGADPETRDVLFPTAAAMLMSREDYDASGGFDRAFFMYHEDVDLGWRLWLLGRRVVVCSDSTVYHAFGGSSVSHQGLSWRDEMGLRHAVRGVLKNYRLANVFTALRVIARILRQQRAGGRALRTLRWNVRYLKGTLVARRWVQRRRRISDDELRQRGLITDAPYPPPTPEAPKAGRLVEPAEWIPSPVLLPGQHSSLGRLGFGWYAREREEGGWLRWTCGRARAFLRVDPNTLGNLTVRAKMSSEPGPARSIQITCNGASMTRRMADDGWTEITLPVCSSLDGILTVEVRARPVWVPHYQRNNGDFRHLGCAVQEIRFRPAVSVPIQHSSTVSVIVPTYNRWPFLERTLEALACQTWRDIEVIVVDDGSTDETWERMHAWQQTNAARLALTPLRQENQGPGKARNLALGHARGDLVLFIGDDTIPDEDLVAQHVAKHREVGEGIGVVGFTDWARADMRVTPFLELVNRDGQQFSYGRFADGEDISFTCLYTSNISLPRRMLGEDPFHPAFTFVDWEDTELGYRLSLRGVRLILHRAAVTRHLHPMTMTSFFRRQKHVGRTVQVVVDLHPELVKAEAMPILDPLPLFPWYRWARFVVPLLLPLLDRWDRLGLKLPEWLYRNVVLTAFFDGRGSSLGHSSQHGRIPTSAATAGEIAAAALALARKVFGNLDRPRALAFKLAARWRRRRHAHRYQQAVAQGELIREVGPGGTETLVSVVTPVYRVREQHLRAAIESIRRQSHGNWELLLLDDASPDPHVWRVLEEAAASDTRIRAWRNSTNAGIAKASNRILHDARGEVVAFLDHDDLIHPRALELVTGFMAANPEIDWVFTDEDKVDPKGEHHEPCIKPGWSHNLLLTFNYVCHMRVVRHSILARIGGHREGFDGAQDYDIALRALAAGARFAHLSSVLYHWRTVPTSMARAAAAKPEAHVAALRALREHAESWSRGGAVSARVFNSPASFFEVRRMAEDDISVAVLLAPGDPHPEAALGSRRMTTADLAGDRGDPTALMTALAGRDEDIVVVPPPAGLDTAQIEELLCLLLVPRTALVAGRAVHRRRVVASGWLPGEDGSLFDPWAGLDTSSGGYLNLAWVPGPRLIPEPWGWAAWREELVRAWEAAPDVPPAWRLAIGCARLGLEVITTPTVSYHAIGGAPPPPPLPIPASVTPRWSSWLETYGLARSCRRATIGPEAP